MVIFSVEKELIDEMETGSPSNEEDSDSLYIDDYVKNDSSAEGDKLYEGLLFADSTHLERILTYSGLDTNDLLTGLDTKESYLTTDFLADPYTREAYQPVETEGNQKSEPQRDVISYCIRRSLNLDPSLCPEVEDSIDMVREDDEDMGRVFRHRFYAIYASSFGAEIALYRPSPAS